MLPETTHRNGKFHSVVKYSAIRMPHCLEGDKNLLIEYVGILIDCYFQNFKGFWLNVEKEVPKTIYVSLFPMDVCPYLHRILQDRTKTSDQIYSAHPNKGL